MAATIGAVDQMCQVSLVSPSTSSVATNTWWSCSSVFLYGDALYRQGEYERAKEFYLGLRQQVRGDDRATATKKIAACNKMLQLPDGDGVHN